MDWFPLWNSLRIALFSTAAVFFVGIFAAYYIAKLPRLLKGVLDVVLTLPLVLPPTVIGYLLLRLLGPKRIVGAWLLSHFGVNERPWLFLVASLPLTLLLAAAFDWSLKRLDAALFRRKTAVGKA